MSVFETMFNSDGLDTLNSVHGATVSVGRGSLRSLPFQARRKAVRAYAYAGPGVDAKFIVREYFLPKSAYVMSNERLEPQPGDLIYDGSDTWELFVPDGSTRAAEIVRGGEWHCFTRRVNA